MENKIKVGDKFRVFNMLNPIYRNKETVCETFSNYDWLNIGNQFGCDVICDHFSDKRDHINFGVANHKLIGQLVIKSVK